MSSWTARWAAQDGRPVKGGACTPVLVHIPDRANRSKIWKKKSGNSAAQARRRAPLPCPHPPIPLGLLPLLATGRARARVVTWGGAVAAPTGSSSMRPMGAPSATTSSTTSSSTTRVGSKALSVGASGGVSRGRQLPPDRTWRAWGRPGPWTPRPRRAPPTPNAESRAASGAWPRHRRRGAPPEVGYGPYPLWPCWRSSPRAAAASGSRSVRILPGLSRLLTAMASGGCAQDRVWARSTL